MLWLCVILFLLGLSLGIVITDARVKKEKTVGTLRVDRSDPDDGPYLFLELETDPRIVEKKTYIYLKVSNKSYLSQN